MLVFAGEMDDRAASTRCEFQCVVNEVQQQPFEPLRVSPHDEPAIQFGGQQNAVILGDDVEVVASREFFGQHLTVNAAVGMVRREDTTTLDETRVELTFAGGRAYSAIDRNPRVLIGTGLTITARNRLVVRLVRTTNANVPVSLDVVARGDASKGRCEEVVARAPQLRLGGRIVRQGRGWTWTARE